jgi:hypothetical protein
MRNTTLSPTALVLACCCTLPAFAQYDTSRLDVGYLRLKKDFTQTITIKGADLEKMPFANLSDAIAAWSYGAYTTPVTLQYVVDGNPVSDVNAYSIYDIEEVVMVQNAAALVNTADGQQELVIVRTRRGRGKCGITAAGQTGLVDSKASGVGSEFRMGHNYYLTGWQNLDKVSFGVSGNYLRDVFPYAINGLKVTTPNSLQRWRLNGYLTWRPDSHNQVELMLNYTPQRQASIFGSSDQPPTYLANYHGTQHFILPRLLWHSDLSSKWTNDLQATYIHSTGNQNDNTNIVLELPPDSLVAQFNGTSSISKSYHLWIRDHLGYKATAGHWSIEPAINASYEHFNEQNAVVMEQLTSSYYGGGPGFGSLPTISEDQYESKGNLILLTPSIDISFKRVLNVQGGVLFDAGHRNGIGSGRKAFPFASLSLDLLRLGNDNPTSALKVFGSYASRTAPSPQGYMLRDLTSGAYINNSPTQSYTSYNFISTTTYIAPYYPPGMAYWVWETGVSYTGWNNRLAVQYTLERRNFEKSLLTYPPSGGSYVIIQFPEWQSTLQHVDVRIKVLDAKEVHWLTGLNATLLQNTTKSIIPNYPGSSTKQDVGDDTPSPHSWTGGWVNRVQVKHFSAGFDLLWHFGESVQSETFSGVFDTVKVNSVITPNIYIGYTWHLPGVQTLECFVESRGLIRNSTNDLLDSRRYYTVGGRLSL